MAPTRNSQLDDDILNAVVEVQSICDRYRAPIEMQDELLRALFEGIGPSKGKQPSCEKPRKSLASGLLQKSKDWDGSLNGRQIPSKWAHIIELYKEMGMVPLQEWKLCLGDEGHDHAPHIFRPSSEDDREEQMALKCRCPNAQLPRPLRRDCDTCCEKCPICHRKRKDVMSFHYISLIGQLKLLCKSEAICWDFLKMWRAKDRWLNKTTNEQPEFIDEFWDGEKTRLYQDFWNPQKEWELPIVCRNPNCQRAHTTFPPQLMSKTLQVGLNPQQDEYNFRCSGCVQALSAKRTWIKGDPRNFALLLHWDGFQAASTTQKDSAVVEIVVLNGGKKSILGSIPVLFLPLSHRDLQKKHGDVLSSFLSPLICELESSFLDGFEVEYALSSENVSQNFQGGIPRLRCMLMMCTGDHPAQCKLGQFKDGGMAFCRRDKAKAELQRDINGVQRYVYNNNRFQGRHPPEKRNVDDMWQSIRMAKRCAVKEKAEDILRDGGLAGESVLWRLYHLYGFDVSRDLVYDVMHVLSLNLFQKYIKRLISSADSHMKKRIDVAINQVAISIPKPIIQAGRWPRNASKHFKMFKAEECQKFVQWCLPHILNVVKGISQEDVQLGMLLIDIAHIFFECSRRKGWSKDYIQKCRSLFLSWRILSEEYYGANSSPLEHVAGNGEILDDVTRHGSHDVTWCFSHERNVSGYLSISTNNKSNELSYSKYHSRVLCTRLYKQLHLEKDGLSSSTRDMLFIHSCLVLPEGKIYGPRNICCTLHEKSSFHTTSEKKAKEVWDACLRLAPCACHTMVQSKGVLVGPKRPKPMELSYAEKVGIISIWNTKASHAFTMQQIRPSAYFYSKVFFANVKYTLGEYVVTQCMSPCHGSSQHVSSILKGRLTKFFSHEQEGEVNVFIVIECLMGTFATCDEISGMSLIPKSEKTNCCLKVIPINWMQHKLFWLPTSLDDREILYETGGFAVRSRLVFLGKIGCIPPWLEIGDFVLAKQSDSSNAEAFVRSVDIENKMVLLDWKDTQLEQAWIHWKYIYKRLQDPNPNELVV